MAGSTQAPPSSKPDSTRVLVCICLKGQHAYEQRCLGPTRKTEQPQPNSWPLQALTVV